MELKENNVANESLQCLTKIAALNPTKSATTFIAQDKVSAGTRPVLGNLTNRLQNHACHLGLSHHPRECKQDESGNRLEITAKKRDIPLDEQVTEVRQKQCDCTQLTNCSHSNSSSDSGHGSDLSGKDSTYNHQPSLTSTGLTQPKLVYHTQPLQSKRIRFDSGRLALKTNDEDGEIDRRPFKSKLACDIVRAAFADRVQLEELLAECRRADFAISALDRTPVDRMMEATDYIVGIMAYEQIRENKDYFQVKDFLASGKQPNLTADMLTTLADWLVEVQENFALNHETIHLAWGLLYAYLDRGEALSRREIQLMACAAIMIACKHEERQMPHLSEFLYITDNAYTSDEFIDAERRLLVAIDFAVHRPNPYVFLRRYARVLDAHSGRVQFTSRFLLEAGMHSHCISLKRESRKAAAVLWLARVVLRNPAYSEWIKRSDVRQLRHLIRTNANARLFYARCYRKQKSVAPVTKSKTSLLDRNVSKHSRSLELNVSIDSATSVISVLNESLNRSDSTHSSNFSNEASVINENCRQLGCVDKSTCSDASFFHSCRSSPSAYPNSDSPFLCTNSSTEATVSFADLDSSVKADLEAMQLEEEQRQPLWPPILEHITGYKEIDLIPLALRYHTIAMRLIAEVARGGHLALQAEATGKIQSDNVPTDLSMHNTIEKSTEYSIKEDIDSEAANARCISPGGHYLRRQSVTKYCSSAFLSVADAYPQLAFDNFVPHFPSVQCAESCACFVCTNLIRRTN